MHLMKSLLTVSLALLNCITGFAATAAEKPNVLILYADDLGYGDVAIENPHSKIPTPNLDELARHGMRFSDAHSSSGICTPSRYALLTGRHHWRDFHGIVNALGESVIQPDRLTMAAMFQRHGYHTGCIGKWHLGWDWGAIRKPGIAKQDWILPSSYHWDRPIPDGPLDHGFDSYFGDTVINFPPYGWIENDKLVKAPDTVLDTSKWKSIKEGRWECRPGPMCSDWDPYQNLPTITAKGVDYIKSHAAAKQPFFLYFAFPCPHAPIIPNDSFDGKSAAGPYGDFVFETDDACGQLLRALDDAGVSENTIVVFSADNGPEKYAYARDAEFDHWSAEPFRGLKRDLYEGGHHVPLIVRWPGITTPGRVCDALVSQIDLFATFADMLQFDLPANAAEDSHDLMPLLTGQTEGVRTTHVHNTKPDQYAIRHGDWLLVDAKTGYVSGRNRGWEAKRGYQPDDGQAVELYNLHDDPGQRANLAREYPKRVEEMQRRLQAIRDQGYSAPRLDSNNPERAKGK